MPQFQRDTDYDTMLSGFFRQGWSKTFLSCIYIVYPDTKERTQTMSNGKEQAFVSAVQERSHQLYRIAMGYLHSAQDAEDAVSDAIESAWKNLKRIRSNDAIPAYLIQCTINSAKTELRRERYTEPLEPYQESLVAHDPGNPISDYFSELREKDQLLLILKYQENLREAEIASVLHVPRGTVSSRLSRLLDRLREELKKEESGNA